MAKKEPMSAEEMAQHNRSVIKTVQEIHRLVGTSDVLKGMPAASVLEGVAAYLVAIAQHFGMGRKETIMVLDHAATAFIAVLGNEDDPVVQIIAAMQKATEPEPDKEN